MLETAKLSDFSIETSNGEILKAHKNVLASRSVVFDKMFGSDMEEIQKSSMKVPDFDSNIMKEFLRYTYCSKVNKLDEISRQLIFVAEKYQLDGLKDLCIKSISSTLSGENVLESIVISDQLNIPNLFAECMQMIQK